MYVVLAAAAQLGMTRQCEKHVLTPWSRVHRQSAPAIGSCAIMSTCFIIGSCGRCLLNISICDPSMRSGAVIESIPRQLPTCVTTAEPESSRPLDGHRKGMV